MKNILITGVTHGIGKVTALKAQDAGYHVFGLDKEAPPPADTEFKDMTMLRCDLSKPEMVEAIIADLLAQKVKFHGLVNNAAEILPGSLDDIDFAVWNTSIEANLTAPLRLCHGLRDSFTSGGAIVNVSSQGGHHAAFGTIPYTFTKAAQINLTQSLAANFGSRRVRVNAVVPGWVNTDSAKPVIPQVAARVTPLGRNAEPREVADAILFLLSEKAAFINGTQLVVDGGYDAIDYSIYQLDQAS